MERLHIKTNVTRTSFAFSKRSSQMIFLLIKNKQIKDNKELEKEIETEIN